MKISKEQIEGLKLIKEEKKWLIENSTDDLLETLLKANDYSPDLALNFFIKLMTKRQYSEIAIFAADQILPLFENEVPNNDVPRKALEAAKNFLKNPTNENQKIAETEKQRVLKLRRDILELIPFMFFTKRVESKLENIAFYEIVNCISFAAEITLTYNKKNVIEKAEVAISGAIWGFYIYSHLSNVKTDEDQLNLLNAVTNKGYEMKKMGEIIVREAVRILERDVT